METAERKDIIMISQPQTVNMDDEWYKSVSNDHFWMKRRYSVLDYILHKNISQAKTIGEIGCGTGLVQIEVENFYKKTVEGIDLNQSALNINRSSKSKLYCYNILENNPLFEEKYDLIFALDVIEHVENEFEFIRSIKYMLKPNGKIVVNVPAFQGFYSKYDEAVGHLRRFTYSTLYRPFKRQGFKIIKWTYWGFPLIPLIILRRVHQFIFQPKKIVSAGISIKSKQLNNMLKVWSKLEFIPQKFIGTSLMMILEKGTTE